jgi:toxin CptA
LFAFACRTMSIAVSAVIRPSRLLRLAQALLCLLVLACCAVVEQRAAAMVLLVAATAGAACHRGIVKPARIDISGVGHIRLTVYHQVDTLRPVPGEPVRLLPGSTLWPMLLLLRLGSADGRVHWLAVLPDSVAPDAMRRLRLAARAIAAHG